MSSGTTADDSGQRAQAAIIGLVLLIGLVAVASIGILLVGADANDQTEDETENERVKQNFLELNSEVDSVAREDNGTRDVDFDLPTSSDAAIREDDTGRIWVNKTNFTTLNDEVVVNESIGAVRYTRDDGTTFAFQGGGVWMEEGNQTRMLSSPAFAYKLNKSGDSPTLTLPIVTTTGDRRLNNGDVRITKNRTVAPTNDVSIVEGELVTVKVKSRWYIGWAKYFREIADPDGVSVNHDKNTATLELVVPIERKRIVAGFVSGAYAEDFELSNNVDFNSYNSTTGTCDRSFCASNGDTEIIVSGDLDITGKATINGDVRVGGELNFDHPQSEVTGNATYGSADPTNPDSTGPPHVGGTASTGASIEDYEPVDAIIDSQVVRAKTNNNNSANPHLSGNSPDFDCNTACELHSGTYFVDSLTVDGNSGNTLVFNTTNGPVNLVVNGTVSVTGGDHLRFDVIGSNRVNIYINSEDPTKDDLFWRQGDVDIPGDRTPQLWIYMDKNANAQIEGGKANLYGVLFGPGDGPSNGVEINFKNQPHIYGAMVGYLDSGSNNPYIFYDEALANAQTVTSSAKVPRLTFLHASVYEVCLRGASQSTEDCDDP